MSFTLDDCQMEAIEKLHTGAILVGGVGSGKTITALAYYFKQQKGASPVVHDKNFIPMSEDSKPLYVITTARKRDSLDWVKEAAIFNVTPIVDSWNNLHKYTHITNAFFFFDEQRVVGSGQWVKSFLKIAKNNEWILLSATPGDTWIDYIPVMIANGYYKNRTEFLRRHVVFNNFSKFPKVDHYVEVGRLIKIKNQLLVNMHVLRHTIRLEHYEKCEHDVQKTNLIHIDRWNVFDNSPVVDASEMCRLMRKVCNSDASRINKIKELYDKHKKVIIFYNFNYELALLEEFANVNQIPYTQWNGRKHEELLREKEQWLYLCQYTAASEAWNAIETDTIIFYSLNYSYKIMEQSSGRIDRRNTPYTYLYYYYLISDSPIDRAIQSALKKKKNFNEQSFSS